MDLKQNPIPHIVGKLDNSKYEFCNSIWKSSLAANKENRYNLPVDNIDVVKYLNLVTKRALNSLLPYLIQEYPKFSFSEPLKIRCQFSGNLAKNKKYVMRDWHLDNGNKILVGLWYFKHSDDTDEGGLHLSNGKDSCYIPYSSNKIVFIPNLTNSWHKVGTRDTWSHERRFINIVVEQTTFLHDYNRDHEGKDSFKLVNNLWA